MKRVLWLLVVWAFPCAWGHGTELPFVIVIPSYNNALYYERNLGSALNQDYTNYRVIYVDDASEDGAGKLVEQYVQENGHEEKVLLIQNEKRLGSLANFYRAIGLVDPNEIVVCLDGDDFLYHARVLAKLNAVYSDPGVWVTYGQFIRYPHGWHGWTEEVPDWVIESNAFREYRWVTTHLKTFYAGLFQQIRKEDLLYEGDFFPMAGDLAFMWPILEMAGVHSRFVPDVLYVYNEETPLMDIKLDRPLQIALSQVICQRQKYTPLNLR